MVTNNQVDSQNKSSIPLALSKSFFGKDNCFRYNHYQNNVVLFHFGKKSGDNWLWKKVKMNAVELADILLVLEGRRSEVSFFHSFEKDNTKHTTQIWASSKETNKGKVVFIKIKELSKGFSSGEQRLLEALINHSLIRSALAF